MFWFLFACLVLGFPGVARGLGRFVWYTLGVLLVVGSLVALAGAA